MYNGSVPYDLFSEELKLLVIQDTTEYEKIYSQQNRRYYRFKHNLEKTCKYNLEKTCKHNLEKTCKHNLEKIYKYNSRKA